jgi:hypothetical protein
MSKSNEITIINTYGIILIFDYLGNRKIQSLKITVKRGLSEIIQK